MSADDAPPTDRSPARDTAPGGAAARRGTPASPPLGPHPDKAEAVAAMFTRIAPRYDLLNRLLSLGLDRGWRLHAAREALAGAPRRLLDVATGTGDVALTLARLAPEAEVVGVDLTPAMLAHAHRKAGRAGVRVSFEVADALALPFEDESFDAVTVAYGLRNFADPVRGIREMRRVLRPGGRLVILEFPPPHERRIGRLLRWYGRTVMPTIGGWLSGDRDAYAYLPASTAAFMAPERLLAELRAAGFGSSRCTVQLFGASALYVAVAA